VDGGLKLVSVGLATDRRIVPFRFVIPIAGVQYAVQRVDFSGLYPPGTIQDMTLETLRTKLESLPCCVKNKEQSADGDPLNLVIVGNGVDALFAFNARLAFKRTGRSGQFLAHDEGIPVALRIRHGAGQPAVRFQPLSGCGVPKGTQHSESA
jgi:hypothetical protein